jgi:transposase InsO family protein
VSKKRSCRLALLQRATWYYKSTARDRSALRARIRDLAHSRPRFGYQRIHILRRREGWPAGRNQVYRLYRLEGLQVRMRVRRRKRISTFLVDMGTPGFQVRRGSSCVSHRGYHQCELVFEGCRVPEENVIGPVRLLPSGSRELT